LDQNENAPRAGPRGFTAAEFARMSSSMKLTVLAILRAQMSARKAVAAAAGAKRLPGDEEDES